jgi:hypothetical protein
MVNPNKSSFSFGFQPDFSNLVNPNEKVVKQIKTDNVENPNKDSRIWIDFFF